MKKIPAEDRSMSFSYGQHPSLVKSLIGHSKEYHFIFNSLVSKNTHHAICVSGCRGIGKASMVYKALKDSMLKSSATTELGMNFVKMFEGRINSDILIVEPVSKSGNGGDISVDHIREIISFAMMKPSVMEYKCVIIDSVDNLNSNSSNAILKLLEKPPLGTNFFLICHNKANVLKTILSRCIILTCNTLGHSEFFDVCNLIGLDSFSGDLSQLGVITCYNPRLAAIFASSGCVDAYISMLNDIQHKTNISAKAFVTIADNGFDSTELIRYFVTRFLRFIAHMSSGFILANELLGFELEVFSKYIDKYTPNPLSVIQKLWQVLDLLRQSENYSCSVKHVVTSIVYILHSDNPLPSGVDIV